MLTVDTHGLEAAAEKFSLLQKPAVSRKRVYQFFSFDIKNSTAYKRAERNWPLLINKFYELTWDRLSKDDHEFQFWKYVGDEILAYRRVRSAEDAWRATQHVHRVLHSVIDSLHKAFPRARQSQLSIKAASWLALCTEMQSNAFDEVESAFQNLTDISVRQTVLASQTGSEIEQSDFLGPTIDSGFRIAKHSGPGILVLSFELAHVLCHYLDTVTQTREHTAFCRLVGYESLTGIWRDRPYPIIWYAPTNGAPFAYFGYDDRLQLQNRIKLFEDSQAQPRLCDILKSIAADVGIDRDIADITSALNQKAVEGDTDSVAQIRPRSTTAEVHCVAVCVNEDGECLVAKRLPSRQLLPNTWEWGCAKLQPSTSFFDSMRTNYKVVFGIDIDFPSERPITSFFVDAKRIPGLVFAARAVTAEVRINPGKHSEFQWVNAARARVIAANDGVVPGFVDTIEHAIEIVRNYQVLRPENA